MKVTCMHALELIDVPAFVRRYLKRKVPYRFRSHLNYALWEHSQGKKLLKYLEMIRFEHGQYQLDVGCGMGGVTIALAEAEERFVIGIDIKKHNLIIAAKLTKEKNVQNVNFVCADAHNLCFRSQTFDSIISTATLEHIKYPYLSLRETKRVLKNGGHVHISFYPFWGPLGGHLYIYLPFIWIHYLPKRVIKHLLARAPKLGIDTPEIEYNEFLELNRLSTTEIIQCIQQLRFKVNHWRFIYFPSSLLKEFIGHFEGRFHDLFVLEFSFLLTKCMHDD